MRAIVPPKGLEVRLIGELALLHRGEELPLPASKKTRALFVYLLQARRPVRRERLCELFFDIPDDPRAALRWSLSKIRRMLGPYADLLGADREHVGLAADRIVTDVDRLRDWANGAAIPDDLPLRAADALEPPLAGLDLDGLDGWNAWLAALRAEIDEVRAEFLLRAAGDERMTPRHRDLLLREAQAVGVRDCASGTAADAAPCPQPRPGDPLLHRARRRSHRLCLHRPRPAAGQGGELAQPSRTRLERAGLGAAVRRAVPHAPADPL